jgi:Collagen triple helix repeat (20 copies)
VKTNKNRFTLVAAILLGLTLNQSVQAYSLHVTDDAYINKKNPSEKTGSKKSLPIGNVDGDRESYVRFDLSALPKDAEITLAMLRLYVNDVDVAGTLTVQEITGSWNESALTAANVPFSTPALTSVPITKATENHYVLVDVTQVVKGWQSGVSNNGLVLRTDVASQLKLEIDSKENERTSHPMEIEVAFEGPPGPKGDKGDKGDNGEQGAKGDNGDPGVQGGKGEAGATGPQGAPGPQGLRGFQGPSGSPGSPGVSGYEILGQQVTVGVNLVGNQFFTLSCPAGKVALNGTANRIAGNPISGEEVNANPGNLRSTTKWNFAIFNRDLFPKTYQLTVVCINAS